MFYFTATFALASKVTNYGFFHLKLVGNSSCDVAIIHASKQFNMIPILLSDICGELEFSFSSADVMETFSPDSPVLSDPAILHQQFNNILICFIDLFS